MNTIQSNANCPESRRSKTRGFTLIEMVVVVLILGIVAAVAVPKMFNTADTAGENATHQQLALLRTALEIYRSQNSTYPPGVDLAAELGPYLRGPFPVPQIGTIRNQAGIAIDTNTDINLGAAADGSAGNGWVYKPANGDIALNLTSGTGSDW